MKSSSDISAKQQIRTLLSVIAAAVAFALVIAALMVSGYGPSGNYLLRNVLLSPQIAETLSGQPVVFDHLEFSEWNAQNKIWNKSQIDLSRYNKFYSLVADDQSLEVLSSEIVEAFYGVNPSVLTLYVRAAKESSNVKPLQVVQFANGKDYFRVEMPIDTLDENAKWAYFFHPSIQSQIQVLFSTSTQGGHL